MSTDFYKTRTRYVKEGTRTKKETYTVTVPLSLEASYANVAALLGREITADDRSNIDYIYAMVAGVAGDNGGGRRGSEPSIDLDASVLADPYIKTTSSTVPASSVTASTGCGTRTER